MAFPTDLGFLVLERKQEATKTQMDIISLLFSLLQNVYK
jgi:hypothetical protein